MNHPLGTQNNYFFVDGSSLLADIVRARKSLGIDNKSRLDLAKFVHMSNLCFRDVHGGFYKRFTFYFVNDPERLESLVKFPDAKTPNLIRDMRIEYCGKRIKELESAQKWLDNNNAPDEVRERLHRSEKAVDTQICCDALQLCARDKLDRLFLYTNDYDFVPLCHTLRRLGANVNLFRLQEGNINGGMIDEFDGFHTLSTPAVFNTGLPSLFVID